jgi:protease I
MKMSTQAIAVNRTQQLMSTSPVPSISTELLTADGELNQELRPSCSIRRRTRPAQRQAVAICCTNGVEEVEILGAQRWLAEHGATVHVVSPRIGEFHPTLGLRFPPQCATHVLAIRLMENAGWLKIDRYTDEAKAGDYDAVLLPGGCWNPDALRMDPHARDFGAMHDRRPPRPSVTPMVMAAQDPQGQGATAVEHPRRRERRRHRARRAVRGRRQPDHCRL